MTSIRKAKFANQTAKRIKNSEGEIPSVDKVWTLVERSYDIFDQMLEKDAINGCPCCAIGDICDDLAKDMGINIPYLNYLRDNDDWGELSDDDVQKANALSKLPDHVYVATELSKHRAEILRNDAYELGAITNRGEMISIVLADELEVPTTYALYDISDFLQMVLDAPKLSPAESGMQPDDGFLYAYWGW